MKSNVNDELESMRLEALRRLRVLDTPPEESFDEIVKLASLICETPVSLVSLVDLHRQWFKAKTGLELNETPREIAFCNQAIQQDDLMIIPDALEDERFSSSPLVTGSPNIRFYAGMPITTGDGFRIGALCVIDSRPRNLTPKQISALQILAKQVMRLLEFRLDAEMMEGQRLSLLETNRELNILNQDLRSSTEEITSNLEQIGRLQNHLEIRDSQYRGLVENATDLIYELDENGRFSFANTVMERVAGYDREELLGKMYWDLVHHSHRDRVIQFYRDQRKSRIDDTYLEFMMVTRGGSHVWIGQNVHMFFREDGYVFKISAISRDISELKEAEEKLESSERRFRLLSDHSPVGIVQTDADGKCIYANKRWCEITGQDQQDALRDGWLNPINTQERHVFFSQWKETLSEIGEFVKEIRLTNKAGDVRWVTTRVNQMTGEGGRITGYIVTVDDITELKETHRKLSEREQLYRLLSTNSKDLISLFKTDADATRTFVSPSSREILGYEPEELIGRSPFEMIVQEDVDHVRSITQTMTLSGMPSTIEFRIRRKDGVIIWMESNAHPYFDDLGNMIGFQSSAREITKRKEFEKSLQESKEKAEEATLAKSKFLSMMSHEIRTPMNAIIGLTNFLLHHNPAPDQKESLEILKFSGENLLTIINDILDFSKIESDKIMLESADFDLYKLILNTKRMLEHRAREKNIDLILRYDESLPQTVKGDSVRLAQVITNLAGNAIKFTDTGNVEFSVTDLGIVEHKHKVQFSVKDTGIGIHPDKIETIFESFAQADSDTTRRFGGTGLGLSITKSLVGLMGSRIEVESEPGRGSTFSFTLLLEPGSSYIASSQDHVETGQGDFRKHSVRLLLVEDNRINQLVASKFLVTWGIEVDIANNGKEALEMIQQEVYDLVLMDVQMPVMDGYEAVLSIRALEKAYYKEIPILALTASAMLGMRDKVMEVGMNDFISKPFVPAELRAKISKFVFGSR